MPSPADSPSEDAPWGSDGSAGDPLADTSAAEGAAAPSLTSARTCGGSPPQGDAEPAPRSRSWTYRGYGASSGTPTLRSARRDVEALARDGAGGGAPAARIISFYLGAIAHKDGRAREARIHLRETIEGGGDLFVSTWAADTYAELFPDEAVPSQAIAEDRRRHARRGGDSHEAQSRPRPEGRRTADESRGGRPLPVPHCSSRARDRRSARSSGASKGASATAMPARSRSAQRRAQS